MRIAGINCSWKSEKFNLNPEMKKLNSAVYSSGNTWWCYRFVMIARDSLNEGDIANEFGAD